MATSYIDKVMEELDATLTANKRELEKLGSLRGEKESERDALKEGILKALEELKALREEASSLLEDHGAFIAESGEATGTEVKSMSELGSMERWRNIVEELDAAGLAVWRLMLTTRLRLHTQFL